MKENKYERSAKLRLEGYSYRLTYWIFYRWQSVKNVNWLSERESEIINYDQRRLR